MTKVTTYKVVNKSRSGIHVYTNAVSIVTKAHATVGTRAFKKVRR